MGQAVQDIAPCMLVCCCAMNLWAWLVFGLLNLPEIERNEYFVPSQCYVFSKSVIPYRACRMGPCSYCTEYHGGQECSSALKLHRKTNKYDDSGFIKSTIEGPCGTGYQCCETECDECCSTDSDGEESCNDCNCRCVLSVDSLQCSVGCSTQYMAHLSIMFPWSPKGTHPNIDHGLDVQHPTELKSMVYAIDSWAAGDGNGATSTTPDKIKEFLDKKFPGVPYTDLEDDLEDDLRDHVYFNLTGADNATSAANAVRPGQYDPMAFPCWYDHNWNGEVPDRQYNEVDEQHIVFPWHLGYTWWKWLLFAIPAAGLLILCFFCTSVCIVHQCAHKEPASKDYTEEEERELEQEIVVL